VPKKSTSSISIGLLVDVWHTWSSL